MCVEGRAKDASTEESNSKVIVNVIMQIEGILGHKDVIYYEETILIIFYNMKSAYLP